MTRWGEIKCPRCAELEFEVETWKSRALHQNEVAGRLEAKLAKVEDFVRRTIRYAGNNGDDFLAEKARTTLAELTGGKDEG